MDLIDRDKKFVWHPFTQVKTAGDPIPVNRAEGVWLYAEDGKKYLDANSSWWTNIHGHGNKKIAEAIYEQFLQLDHVIFAGATHPAAINLSEKIVQLLPDHFSKVFFSDNGSTAVEVAIKMAFQYWFNLDTPKNRFLAIEGAYHGDTFGAMSVGQRGYFNEPFEHLFFDVDYLPFPDGKNDEEILEKAEELFKTGDFAGFIFEPLVQGSAGMRIYKPEILSELLKLAQKYHVLTIADEIMTGFYRTGKFLATNYIQEKVDIVCLSKGLTGGIMPLGLTVATEKIFEAFLADETTKALLHGHSFTGNALSCAASLASIQILESDECQGEIAKIAQEHLKFVDRLTGHQKVKEVRSIGTILRVQLENDSNYFSSIRDKAYNFFLSKGILLRPLGNVIFINPPYCITEDELNFLYNSIEEFLENEA